MIKKSKNQKGPEQQTQKTDKPKTEKKNKSKKKKKQPVQGQNKKNQQDKEKSSTPSKKQKLALLKQQKNQQKIQPKQDQIDIQLNQLQYDGKLASNAQICKSINQKLEQLTINLFSTMLMKPHLIYSAIKIAKMSNLTPKQYFFLDYTNKLLLISSQLQKSSPLKYKPFIDRIEKQVQRVQNLIIRTLFKSNIYSEVLNDLKNLNTDWEPDFDKFE